MKRSAHTLPSALTARREFLRRGALFGAMAGSPLALNLMLAGEAAAQSANDYKSLVCLFMHGGNDQSNTVVPRSGSAYAAYQSARSALALPGNTLLPITPQNFSGPDLGLHPSLGGLQSLFANGRCAVLANVGVLSRPITRAQWNSGNAAVQVPYQLFSHSDQSAQWQSAVPNGVSDTGWLGRVGDLIAPTANSGSALSICLSVAGDNLLQVGSNTVQYQLTTDGAVPINQIDSLHFSPQAANAMRTLLTAQRSHRMQAQYTTITKRALDNVGLVTNALAGVTVNTPFPSTRLGRQLRMVARMIAARSALGQRRQIFFVASGGWDFHDNLLTDQAARLGEVDAALTAFYNATLELGVAQSVTSFTASEFGRALQSNGRGSDHGWGGHQFIVGGAVQGQRVYGSFPTVALGGPEDSGQGRLIPTTAVDQYAATLSRWFGVSSGDLSSVLPNIGRFASSDLGFLA